MIRRGIISLLVTLGLSASLPGQAATIQLQPSQSVVQQTAVFTVNVLINASDTLGDHPGFHRGAVIVSFDPTLISFNSGSLALGTDIDLYLPLVEGTSGGLKTLTFGFYDAPDVATVASLAFTAIGQPGSLAAIKLADSNRTTGSFFNTVPTKQRFEPGFIGTSVEISAVPLPGAAWLIITAFGALASRVRWSGRTRRGA